MNNLRGIRPLVRIKIKIRRILLFDVGNIPVERFNNVGSECVCRLTTVTKACKVRQRNQQ